MTRARLTFWLFVMDVIAARGGFGSRLYLWALGRASANSDWGVCAVAPRVDKEPPA